MRTWSKWTFNVLTKNINGFRPTYDLLYFLIDCLSQIKDKKWSYCFCVDYKYRRKCELCTIVDDFNDFEELVGEKLLDKHFLLDYHKKLFPYVRRLFFAKKTSLMKFTRTIIDYFHKKWSGNFIWEKLLMNY